MLNWNSLCIHGMTRKKEHTCKLVLPPLSLFGMIERLHTNFHQQEIHDAAGYLKQNVCNIEHLLVPIHWELGLNIYWALVWIPTKGALDIQVLCPTGTLGESRLQELRHYLPILQGSARTWRGYAPACGSPDEMHIEEIVNAGEAQPDEIRMSALISMAIIAEQCHSHTAGLDQATRARTVIEGMPMSQLTDRLTAIAITEAPALGVANVHLTPGRPCPARRQPPNVQQAPAQQEENK